LRRAGSLSPSLSLDSSSDSSEEKLSIFSGHDTVIAPVLAALGVYKDELCVWPPYASRIVFELWERQGQGQGTDRRLYVRVIYNGKDVTPNIPACTAERSMLKKGEASMCSLEALEGQVQSMLGHHTTLKDAC
jgi:acid phosphatase